MTRIKVSYFRYIIQRLISPVKSITLGIVIGMKSSKVDGLDYSGDRCTTGRSGKIDRETDNPRKTVFMLSPCVNIVLMAINPSVKVLDLHSQK